MLCGKGRQAKTRLNKEKNMSYNQYTVANKILENLEKNYTSVSKFIQPDWLRVYYDNFVESNFSMARIALSETEKAFSVKK